MTKFRNITMWKNVRLTPLVLLALAMTLAAPRVSLADPVRPEHITPEAELAIQRGLDYLVRTQSQNGSWTSTQDGRSYPVTMASLAGMAFLAHGDTPTRGPYADALRKTVRWVMTQQQDNGLLSSPVENGRPMYGHGFSMLFLATAYGMEEDERVRQRMADVIDKAITLTAKAQSPLGGWTYQPGAGDEGSVTITQMQALRAAHNAGFTVPEGVIENSLKYLEKCRGPEGGIVYSYSSRGQSRLPISAAALVCMYSAGEYESDMADACLRYVFTSFEKRKNNFNVGSGHDFYAHNYAAQAFYQAGDKYWNAYFPGTRDQLIKMQSEDGSWQGDGIGNVYGTALGCTILQLPYKFLPIYQR